MVPTPVESAGSPVLEMLGGFILKTIDQIFIMANGLVYDFIGFLYELYIVLSSAQIFSSATMQDITNRVYIVVGVAALFLVAYALLKAIIDPDAGGKEYSVNKIVPNILKVVILIAIVPTLFTLAYRIQDVIFGSKVMTNLVFEDINSKDSDDESKDGFDYKDVGKDLAVTAFTAFLHPAINPESGEPYAASDIEITDCSIGGCQKDVSESKPYTFADAKKDVKSGERKFSVFANFASLIHSDSKNNSAAKLEYNGIFQLVVGIFMIYIFFNFCIDMGVRAVKLGYYQIIAPIPILTLLLPGQRKVFENWRNYTISTFIDVFIRIFALLIGIYAINHLPTLDQIDAKSIISGGESVMGFARIFLILGILLFIKQAPKLLEDLLGIKSGSFKLGIKDKLSEMPLIGGAVSDTMGRVQGAATGAAGAAWTAKANGQSLKSGLKYGAYQGWRDGGNQFNKQRQGIYSKVYGGKGKAGWLGLQKRYGGQAILDYYADQNAKTTKNQYRENAKSYLIERETRDNFKQKYTEVYERSKAQHTAARDEFKAQLDIEIGKYNDILSEFKKKRDSIDKEVINNLRVEQEKYNKAADAWKSQRVVERQMLEMEYQRAKEKGDSQAQLAAANKLLAFDNEKYSNPEMERKIANMSEDVRNLQYYNDKINEYNIRLENDDQIDHLKASVAKENKYLKNLEDESSYIKGELKDENGKYIVRNIENDKKMANIFTDTIETARGEFAKEHPTYKQYYTRNAEYEKEAKTTAWLNTDEGQHMVAALGKHSGDIGKGIKVNGPPPPGKKE